MTTAPRYAVYYAPHLEGALARFGAELLGYDIFDGSKVPFPPELVDEVPDWASLTRDARRYGFHGTLKAPFALASGRTEEELIKACEAFGATARTVPVIKPILHAIDGFAAVVPAARSDPLDVLARHCVETFDVFRAELTPDDRARRNPARLTPRQIHHLGRWGYPYVFEDFRFHMTLTARLPEERKTKVLGRLQERYAALALHELSIDRIVLVRQRDSDSSFRVVREFLLRSS